MALLKTKGLVVKEIPLNDTDKMLTVITKDYGKISVSARNARKGGTRSSYGTLVFTYGEYVLFKTKSGYSLNSSDVITQYYDLSEDIIRFTHAAHIMDMASDATSDVNTSEKVINILLYALQALRKGRTPALVSSAFSLKLMQITGYPPHITSCVSCGTRDMDEIHFSFSKCGFICENCAKQDSDIQLVDIGVAKAILFVLCAENSGIFNFELSDKVLEVFSKISLKYVEERLEKKYTKLDFLKEFKIQ